MACSREAAAWMVASTLLATTSIPALALFQAGLLGAKDSVSVLRQILGAASISIIMWFVIGFSLVFGDGEDDVIGSPLRHALLAGVSTSCSTFEPAVPDVLFMLFEGMFAVLAPLLATGAWAGRFRLAPALVFVVLFEVLCYYPVAHAIWGRGVLSSTKWRRISGLPPVLDFAGGIVVHTTSGIAAFAVTAYLGTRHPKGTAGEVADANDAAAAAAAGAGGGDALRGVRVEAAQVEPIVEGDVAAGAKTDTGSRSSVRLAEVGFLFLWLGSFGFNGGAAFGSSKVAIAAVANTQIAAVFSAAVWLVNSAGWEQRPSAVALMQGAIAGMAGIAPTSGYVSKSTAAILGVGFGLASIAALPCLRHFLRLNDALSVSAVHGVTSILGSLAVGICGDPSVAKRGGVGMKSVLHGGSTAQLAAQAIGVLLVGTWTALASVSILILMEYASGWGSIAAEMPMPTTKGKQQQKQPASVADYGAISPA